MVSKTLLFSCIASLVHLVISDASPPQAATTVDGLPDFGTNPSLGDIQALLSRHITDLSDLLHNFSSTVNIPVRTEHPILQAPIREDSSTAAAPCDCRPPISPDCQILCGTHGGDEPKEPSDHIPGTIFTDSNHGATDPLPLAGLLPLRLSCTCTPPIAVSCKILCANHGGTVWQPPKDVKMAPFSSSESTQPRLRLQEDHISNPASDSANPLCDCNQPTTSTLCVNLCANHGGDSFQPPDNAPLDTIPHPLPTPGQGHDGQIPPPAPPSQPELESCNCNNPTAGACQILCANHGGQANGSDDTNLKAKLQNASMPWPATDPVAEVATIASLHESDTSLPKVLTLSVQTSPDSSTPINADIDLSSYASFATHSAITALGLGGEIHTLGYQSQAQSVSGSNQLQTVIGTITLQLPQYNLHEAFYVVEPELAPVTTSPGDGDGGEKPADFTVGVDFLLQIGGLAVGSHLFA
ncbi:hypothetical protein LTR84_005898 [Exophiala bonariae]|uniref:Uncharacterized protein n=1 Tax=Exophiala bonariae TaxID=1690606 RepID=A0AAV9N5R7_9EURO|nr:hypothetical protein LTR84_005898 [Exophiala bonariae]